MGSYATLLKQVAVLAAVLAALTWAAPDAAKLWVAGAGALAVAFFAAVSVWRHRQIRRLSSSIDEVLHGGREVRFSKCREGDVAVLANELEKMVARLARTTEQLQQERNALADSLTDVSHQIRTPLTAAELMLPAIERMDDPAQRKRAIRELEEMLERVAWLVTTLLKIAKVDAGAITAQAADVDVASMIDRATTPLEVAFDLHDVTLKADVAAGTRFTGDALWTAEALENILKNCMEHTPAGGTVRVEATENALATTIIITDTGPGISSADLPHIFDRFYRGRASTPERPEGFGIGLALAQALISVQGGTLRATNAAPTNATPTNTNSTIANSTTSDPATINSVNIDPAGADLITANSTNVNPAHAGATSNNSATVSSTNTDLANAIGTDLTTVDPANTNSTTANSTTSDPITTAPTGARFQISFPKVVV